MKFLTKQKETHGFRGQSYGWGWAIGGWLCKGIVREFGIGMFTLLYFKLITNKDLLYSTWNSAQCYVAAWMGWEEGLGENGYVYTYGWVPSLFTWNYYNIVNQLLEKEMATHSGIHAWKIPWTKEPGRLQSMGLQRAGHDWVTSLSFSISYTPIQNKKFL